MNPYLAGGATSFQSVYDVSTTALHPAGTRGVMDDGRVFYYCHNTSGATLAAGELQVYPEDDAQFNELAVAAASAAVGAQSIGSITLGSTAVTAGLFVDGFINVTDNTGFAQTYKIKDHATADASATDFSVELYDHVRTALDATSTVSLHNNPYRNPQQGNADQVDIPVGVAPVAIADARYGWLQTWGECSVLFDEAIATVGQAVTIGSSTVGSVEEDDTATTVSQEFIVGWNVAIAVDTERQLVYLTIRP